MEAQKEKRHEDVVTISCINFKTAWGEKETNLKKMKEMVGQAAEQGSNLIIFPELALSGYECDEPCTMHSSTAETIPGPSTEEMEKLAAPRDVYVVFGMPERDKDKKGVRYNSSVLVGPEGVLGRYRKIHLGGPPWWTERKCFAAGSDLPIFETRYGLLGIQICYDFWMFPELSRILALKGAEIIVNTAASSSGPGKSLFMVHQTVARATENTVFVASANLVGKERTMSFYGHSTIAGPSTSRYSNLYAEGGEGEEIVTASLNLRILPWWRERIPWQSHRQAEVILEEFRQLSKDK